jgi:uroporphyrinogen-III decarboxylase
MMPSSLPENWSQMTPEQKRQYRLNKTLDTSAMKFPTPEAEKAYKIQAQRMVDVYNIREPDRVPVNLPVGNLPFKMAGISTRTAMYDYEKAIEATRKFNEKYGEELEYTAMPYFITPGKILDLLDYKLYAWPGHGIAEDGTNWQFIEGEYMKVEEYDDLIRDPSDFWIRKYLPRAFGILEPMRLFQPFTNMTENVHVMQFMPLAMPQVQEMLQKMLEVGKEYQKIMQLMMSAGRGSMTMFMGGGFAKVPFDTIGDTLRGTKGIMQDMFRCPDKLLEALDVVADLTISTILNMPNIANMTMVMYPLHKGADGWMSQKTFDTFYWPPMKKVMDALINEGLIQTLFAEGSYNTRLEYVGGFPKGSVTWYFDRTDMARAKEILGKDCCLQGNVPTSMLVTGESEHVKEYCRKLIQEVGKGGGFILAGGAIPDNPKLENLQAMMAAVREYGYYKK